MSQLSKMMTPEELAPLRKVDSWRGIVSILFTWAWIAAGFALYIWRPSWWTFLISWTVISGRHLALAILMHEGAHHLLIKDKAWNDRVSQWALAYPILTDTIIYRMIHVQHHKSTWTKADPDLGLAKPFPITPASFRRKILRDLTGETGYQRYRSIIRLSAGLSPNGKGLEGKSLPAALKTFAQRQKGFLITNALLLAALSAFGRPEAYVLLWIVPAMTGYSLVLRLRSIAEHAAISDPADELRQTRTTLAPFWVRFFLAPHNVNYHLEHHLAMWVPQYNLPKMHQALMARGALASAEIERSYLAVWKKATSRREETGGVKRRAEILPFSGG